MRIQNNVPAPVAQKAMASVANHPLCLEAKTKYYCESEIFEQSKNLIDRAKFSEEERKELHSELENVSTVLLVCFFTSDVEPEPLSGYGKQYAFVLHPESFVVLKSSVGTWRS
jgi:hypothetical protein